eukprot:360328-Chlamydomonas_euryale.AAC.22
MLRVDAAICVIGARRRHQVDDLSGVVGLRHRQACERVARTRLPNALGARMARAAHRRRRRKRKAAHLGLEHHHLRSVSQAERGGRAAGLLLQARMWLVLSPAGSLTAGPTRWACEWLARLAGGCTTGLP